VGYRGDNESVDEVQEYSQHVEYSESVSKWEVYIRGCHMVKVFEKFAKNARLAFLLLFYMILRRHTLGLVEINTSLAVSAF